jgi:hypothetical protein
MAENDDTPGGSAEKAKQQIAETLHEMVEPFITPLLAKAAEVLVSKGGERALDALQAPKKVFVQVLDSDFKNGHHSVHFKVVNSSLHGVYLDSLELDAPKGKFTVKHRSSAGGWGREDKVGWERRLLAPQTDYAFTLTFPECQNPTYTSQWSGQITLEISQLDEIKPEFRKIPFRIRWN